MSARYRVLKKLGHGAMAEVFLAELTRADAPFLLAAVKRPLPHLLAEPAILDMFLDESRLASKLEHPVIARTLEVGAQDGEPFIAFEFVDGVGLKKALSERGPPLRAAALEIARSLADALAYAHAFVDGGEPAPVVHRDVSLENVLIDRAGAVKLIDFGIAKARGRLRRTATGALLGKVEHMAPEQALARPVGPPADVFALGTVLAWLLCGRGAFAGKTPREKLARITRGEHLPWPAEVPSEVVALLERMLTVEPVERPSAAEVRDALAHSLEGAGAPVRAELASWVAPLLPEASSFEDSTVTQVDPDVP